MRSDTCFFAGKKKPAEAGMGRYSFSGLHHPRIHVKKV
ncbi:Unknown protein sequence [Pseudomonas savastanoi pv. glycinea]|uniref:Uncharacterized protein n=1 Tax=Pseudomonas savastanoi pv. glycinea TaxID=318 RepID=A0ABR5L5Q7_PSESG|nr:Unknown protein sequence [Pseudomonas savastanoi pv. phaseolicola]KPB66877.1 Unknown protein sequence [Pseudomonas amygdali pv. mellea]KPC30402.1 Unknown protein sequence [Pseudomonas savastanoi pv. glycinea]KPB46644.1 Unknown protein sequence [Pseudomonas savastanoi pv. phaseolicola]KPB65396.1 Unknown protein sequence [Pseudomonas savastanoi pv. phaseolicola]